MIRTLFTAAALIAAPSLAQAPSAPAPAQAPSVEAQALGEELARQGLLGTLLPIMAAKETEELVAKHPELSEADQATLRATAAETARTASARVIAAQGRIYAEQLTLEDLRTLTTQNRTPAATRFKAVQPAVIAGTAKAMEGVDFKKEVMGVFCKRTGKGCQE